MEPPNSPPSFPNVVMGSYWGSSIFGEPGHGVMHEEPPMQAYLSYSLNSLKGVI